MMMTMRRKTRSLTACTPGLAVFAFLVFMMLPTLLAAESGPFTAGTNRLSIVFGSAVAFDQNYTVFGMGGGTFVADGVEVGLDAEVWSGNYPHIEQLSPEVRVVLSRDGVVQPYAGIFYRRTVIEDYRNLETAGVRAGVFFLSGRNAYFGAGLAEEIHLNCDRTVYTYCAETYPELLFAVIF